MKNYITLFILAIITITGNSFAKPTIGDIAEASSSIKSAIKQLTYAIDSAAKATDQSLHTGSTVQAEDEDWLKVTQAVAKATHDASTSVVKDFASIIKGPGKHPNIADATEFAQKALHDIEAANKLLSK